jgi:hypothetical protein
MSFRTSDFPGGYERHLLRRIHHVHLFGEVEKKDALLVEAISKDEAYAGAFSEQFERVLERAVSMKPNEDTEVVLAVKAELDRLYTVTGSLGGQQKSIREAIVRLIELTMQSVRRAAGNDVLAVKELKEEDEARSLHFKLLDSPLVADLLNSDLGTGVFIPEEGLIPSLLSAEKSELADAIQLFDLQQTCEMIQRAEQFLKGCIIKSTIESHASEIAAATENLEFIKGYRVYLEDNF